MFYVYNIIIYILYGGLISTSRLKNKKSILIFLAFLHFGFIHALRSPSSFPDTLGYQEGFYRISQLSISEILNPLLPGGWEVGYQLYNYLLSVLFDSHEALFISTSLFMVGAFMWITYKWSHNVFLTVLLYLLHPLLFIQSMSGMRQHIAIAFLMCALYWIRKPIKSILFAVIAFTFHYSAIIFFPFYIFYNSFIKCGNILRPFSIGLLITIVSKAILWTILSNFNIFARYNDYQSTAVVESSNNIVPLVMLSAIFLYNLTIRNYKIIKKDCDKILLSYIAYGVLIAILAYGIIGAGRLTGYYIYFIPLSIPLIFKTRHKSNLICATLISMVLCALILYLFIQTIMVSEEYMFMG